MYKVIGADRNEYGPINLDQLRQWIAEGRVNAQTMIQAEGSAEWKPLSAYPELAPLLPPAPAPLAPVPVVSPIYSVDPARQVQGPAIGLLVTAILGLASAVAGMGVRVFGFNFRPEHPRGGEPFDHLINLATGGFGLIQTLFYIAAAVLILVGALRMMKCQNYQLALVSAVLALVPCASPCCLIGLPIGIWALVVLLRPEVKALFR